MAQKLMIRSFCFHIPMTRVLSISVEREGSSQPIRIGVSSAHQNLMANSFTTVSRSNLSESDLELVATVGSKSSRSMNHGRRNNRAMQFFSA